MKRFGMYDNDFNSLFECYSKVRPGIIDERTLPSETRDSNVNKTGKSFPGLKSLKIFIQQPGRGADLRHLLSNLNLMSDDGDGGVVLSGDDGSGRIHASITKRDAQVKIIDPTDGRIENEFITRIQPKFDPERRELSIIHVEEL